MITNQAEIRIAIQAILITVLAMYGFYGCAFLVLLSLLPWKPLLAVGAYLAQPVVDWRLRKTQERYETGISEIEEELDALFSGTGKSITSPQPGGQAVTEAEPKKEEPETKALAAVEVRPEIELPSREHLSCARELASALEIGPAIEAHVKQSPQEVFSAMKMEVEEVKFSGDAAEAHVRFQSPHLKQLTIEQRYVLRKVGDRWEVESRSPANGSRKASHHGLKAPLSVVPLS